MFYKFAKSVCSFLVKLLNGHFEVQGKENLPDSTYIVVAPHRTWWEPILFALAIYPMEASFMAKEELFKNPILRYILEHAHAFPVDRKNPGPSVIKIPVKNLTKEGLSVIMFPSGTRYSSSLKGGSALIAKLSQRPLMPMVYQGPLRFRDVLKRQKMTVAIGNPIYVDRKNKLTEEETEKINDAMKDEWDRLDKQIDPNFKYDPEKK